MGWKVGSKEAATYVHLSRRDLDNKMLALHGLKEEEQTEEQMKPIECPICQEQTRWTNRGWDFTFCRRCYRPFHKHCIQQHSKSNKGQYACPVCRQTSFLPAGSEIEVGLVSAQDNRKQIDELVPNENNNKDVGPQDQMEIDKVEQGNIFVILCRTRQCLHWLLKPCFWIQTMQIGSFLQIFHQTPLIGRQ